MLSTFKRAFGYVTVEQKNGVIHVEGIPVYSIQSDIRRIWGTSQIEAWMFNDIDRSSFSFNAFFALDVVYAIEKLLLDRATRSSRRVLHQIIKAMRENTWLAHIDFSHTTKKLNHAKLSVFHSKRPMPKQLEFFDTYERTTQQYGLLGMLLAAAAGSGKTLGSLMLSEMLETDVSIIVSPINAVLDVWVKTLETEMKPVPKFWHSLSGEPVKGNERYLIVHYEALTSFQKYLSKLHGKKVYVNLDESHNFNSPNTLRTDLFIHMCRELRVQDVLWMSGTPIKALGSEAIPLFRSIDPLFTADTEYRFKKIFGLSSNRGADILNARLGIMSYKVEKKDLPIEDPEMLPPVKVRIPNGHEYTLDAIGQKMAKFVAERQIYYDGIMATCKKYFYEVLDNHARMLQRGPALMAYEQYRRDLQKVIASGGDARFCAEEIKSVNAYENKHILPHLDRENQLLFKDRRSVVKYVMLKIRGECLGRVVAKERMRAHYDMVSHIDFGPIVDSSEKKTVVFTSFVEVLERLLQMLGQEGMTPVSVYGKTNMLLSATLKRFEQDDKVNPLVATYKSLSTAVPLLMADVIVLIDAPFRDYILQQTISRTSRLGATTRTTVHMFTLDTGALPNIASRSYDILKWSQSQIESIIGIKSPFEIAEDQLADGVEPAMEELGFVMEGMALDEGQEWLNVAALEHYLDGLPNNQAIHLKETEDSIEVTPVHRVKQHPFFMGW